MGRRFQSYKYAVLGLPGLRRPPARPSVCPDVFSNGSRMMFWI